MGGGSREGWGGCSGDAGAGVGGRQLGAGTLAGIPGGRERDWCGDWRGLSGKRRGQPRRVARSAASSPRPGGGSSVSPAPLGRTAASRGCRSGGSAAGAARRRREREHPRIARRSPAGPPAESRRRGRCRCRCLQLAPRNGTLSPRCPRVCAAPAPRRRRPPARQPRAVPLSRSSVPMPVPHLGWRRRRRPRSRSGCSAWRRCRGRSLPPELELSLRSSRVPAPPPAPVGGGCSAEAPGLTAHGCCRRSPARPPASSRMREALPPPRRGGGGAAARGGTKRSERSGAASRLRQAWGGTRAALRARLVRAGRDGTGRDGPATAPTPHLPRPRTPPPAPALRTGPRTGPASAASPRTPHQLPPRTPAQPRDREHTRGAHRGRACDCGTDTSEAAEARDHGSPCPATGGYRVGAAGQHHVMQGTPPRASGPWPWMETPAPVARRPRAPEEGGDVQTTP